MTATLDTPVREAAAPAPAAVPAETARPTPYRWRWLAYSAVLASTVMELLDSTIVGVAAPAIRADLGGSYASLQWMAAGYTLTLAVMLLIGGRLGDLFGRKRMLLIGVTGFTVASVACGLAVSPEMLIASRVLQAAFSAVMVPQGFGLIRDLFPPNEMAKAWAVFGPIMGLSAVVGPIIGGTLVDADLFGTGWRSIFLVNVPVGLFTLLVALRFVPASQAIARSARLDLPGTVLAATGTFLLIYPLVQGRELGWPAWTKVMLAASVVVLAVFARYQVRRKRSGSTPIVEPSLFTRRAYVAGVVFALIFFAAMAGTFIAGIFLQVGLGYTPMQASLAMAPWAVGAVIGSAFGGVKMPVLGRKILHIGLALMGVGVLGLYVAYQLAGVGVDGWDMIVPNLVGGAGMGMIFVPLFDIILGGVADHEIGSANGVLGSIEQLGIALGVAVLGTVFFGILGGDGASHAGAGHANAALEAAGTTALATVGLIAAAFLIGFLLPKKARVGAHG
jgi:EmrB/QacA subfamily drug resistance transporter